MSTVIYLSNQDVKALVGTGAGGRASVERVCRAQAPEGVIINGVVADEDVFIEFLADFWEKNKLPRKGVTLLLGSAQAVTKLILAPKMNHRKMMEYLPREFASVERTTDPVYSYITIGQEGAKSRILASMVDRSFLEPHVKRFQALGIRLESAAMATVAGIYALNYLSYLRDKTCMVQFLDGMSLLDVLYVDGKYYQFSRSRVFGQRGTPAFGVECARSISKQQQFLKTLQVESEMTHVYLGGEFSEEDYEVCRDSILQMDSSLEVDAVHEEPGGPIHLRVGGEGVRFDQFMTLAGGLMLPKDKSSLWHQYRKDPKVVKRRRELAGYLAPSVAAAVVLGAASCGLGAVWFSRAAQIDRQYDYMENAEVIGREAEYDGLMMENQTMEGRIAVIEKTWQNLQTYPLYTSRIKQAVAECAAGLAAAEIKSYGAELGTVAVDVSAGGSEAVHQFVARLEERTDLFEEIYYDGFNFDEQSGSWKTTVTCYLPENAAAEGGEGA